MSTQGPYFPFWESYDNLETKKMIPLLFKQYNRLGYNNKVNYKFKPENTFPKQGSTLKIFLIRKKYLAVASGPEIGKNRESMSKYV